MADTADAHVALGVAISAKDVERLVAALHRGASPNAWQNERSPHTYLMLAADYGFADGLDALLQAPGVDVNIQNWHGDSALMIAAGHFDGGLAIRMSESLLAAGANVNAASKVGWTPLLISARQGNARLFKLLAAAGANPSAVMNDGRTAYQVAEAAGSLGVIAEIRALEMPAPRNAAPASRHGPGL